VALPTSRIETSPSTTARAARPGAPRLDFQSLVASLNPLMHVPVIGGIYSAATGERPIPAVRIFVATLLAGPIGLAAAIADSVVEEATGKTMVDQAIAAITPGGTPEQAAAPAPGRAQSTAPLRLFPEPAASAANTAEPPPTPASTVDAAPARPRSLLPPPPA
jgi:hypothetical protein